MRRAPVMLVVCSHCQATNRVPTERAIEDPTCGKCGEPILPGAPIELRDASFEPVVARTEVPVVVDFWAAWCGPCRMMAPQFEQAAARLKGRALLVKVNSDENPQTAARFGIRSIPTLVMLQGGREVMRQAGATQAAQIVAWATAPADATTPR
jgi:thioredoxin 2